MSDDGYGHSDDPYLDEVIEWSQAMGAARVERDQAIREAHAARLSLRVIAEAAGLSHAGIKKIVERDG